MVTVPCNIWVMFIMLILCLLYLIVTVPCNIWVMFIDYVMVDERNYVTVPCNIWVMFILYLSNNAVIFVTVPCNIWVTFIKNSVTIYNNYVTVPLWKEVENLISQKKGKNILQYICWQSYYCIRLYEYQWKFNGNIIKLWCC